MTLTTRRRFIEVRRQKNEVGTEPTSFTSYQALMYLPVLQLMLLPVALAITTATATTTTTTAVIARTRFVDIQRAPVQFL